MRDRLRPSQQEPSVEQRDLHPRASCRSRRFGRFELQPEERRLLADGQPVALGARAFDLLVVLVERAGQLVAKNDLLTLVWPGLVVEENNLQVQISTLRKVLGQSAITTIPGRGYRFELPVERGDALPPETAPAGSAAAASAAAPGPVRARTNLPTRLLSLYGRAQDVATIKALLRQHVVVTVVGAGGIGKTRVAQAVAADIAVESAADFPDGVWWVELAALSDGALVPSAVARALGVQLAGDRLPGDAIASLLASQRLLLVLDNCEHLTDAVAAVHRSRAGRRTASTLSRHQPGNAENGGRTHLSRRRPRGTGRRWRGERVACRRRRTLRRARARGRSELRIDALHIRRRSSRSAGGWTAFRSPSNSRRRGCRCLASKACGRVSTNASTCSPQARASCCAGIRRCVRRWNGVTAC